MAASELDEIVGELYLVPPTDFVSVRNDLVRQARSSKLSCPNLWSINPCG